MGRRRLTIGRQRNHASRLFALLEQLKAMELDRRILKRHQRKVALLLAQRHLRHLRRLVDEFDGDLEIPLILGAVACLNLGTGMADDVDSAPWVTVACQKGQIAPCSASEVSAATALPRETVRRKLNKLVDQGVLARQGSSYTTTTKPLDLILGTVIKEELQDWLHTNSAISQILDNA